MPDAPPDSNNSAAQLQIVPELLNVVQAASLCGLKKSNFYQQLSAGVIGPLPIKLGRSVRFSRAALLTWIDAGCPPRSQWQVRQHRTQTNMRLNQLSTKVG